MNSNNLNKNSNKSKSTNKNHGVASNSGKSINWFPGHMAKTKRIIGECLPQVDLILELIDARIPYSSKNPEIEKIINGKPKIIVMTKSSLANPDISNQWIEYYKQRNISTVLIDSTLAQGLDSLSTAVGDLMKEKLQRYNDKGMSGKKLKAMIVGIPNVGKSSLINRLAGGKKAKVENRPGVTLVKQWVPTEIGLDLLDMPGVLWPKFQDESVGQNLAITGAIRDQILDVEDLAMILCGKLLDVAKKQFMARYKLEDEEIENLDAYDVFELVGRKRGFLMAGGHVDFRRTAEMLLEEFRSSKIGRITLERPKGF